MKKDSQRVSTWISGLQVDGSKRRTTGCDGSESRVRDVIGLKAS